MKSYLPPAMILAALAAYFTGALDRLGFEGAGQGLAMGALVCAPIWLFNIWRRSRDDRRDTE